MARETDIETKIKKMRGQETNRESGEREGEKERERVNGGYQVSSII